MLLRGRRSGGVSVGKEKLSCSLVGLAAWYFRGAPVVIYVHYFGGLLWLERLSQGHFRGVGGSLAC